MKRTQRSLFCETLENRALMAGDLGHNFLQPHDVNDDRMVSPSDALRIINRLNRPEDNPTSHAFEDVNDDSKVTPLDALLVINDLNLKASQSSSQEKSAELAGATGARARLELETEGPETELSIRMDGAAPGKTYAVTINDIALGNLLTDARGRGRLELSQGDDSKSHKPIPDGLLPLSPDMELVIGDVVRGKLSSIKVEDSSNSSSSSSSSNSTTSSSAEFVATLPTVNKVQSSAEYEIETEGGATKRKFKAELERATPGAVFQVKVGDTVVGSITADSKGKGKLIITTNPKGASDVLMPATFPTISEATVVSIGEASASFKKIG